MFTTALLSLLSVVAALPSNVIRSSSASTYSITMINNCSSTVWPAGWQTNTAGGVLSSEYKGSELASGKSWTAQVPTDAFGVQFWARQECTGSASSGDFYCEVGDCSGYECTDLNWQGGVIVAEFGAGLGTSVYNTDITSYDLSAIGGNNVGMKLVPSLATCETKTCPATGCAASQAWSNADQSSLGSPADTICSDEADYTLYFCPS